MESTIYCELKEGPIETTPIPQYTPEEHGTWALLLAAQERLAAGRICQDFLQGLKRIDFPKQNIPRLVDVSRKLTQYTGWKIMRVDGLVHPRDFFNLLSRKIFPSTDFIRQRSELNYTPAPDMFHDLFGHTPLLTDPNFTDFFETFGKVGVTALQKYPTETHPIHEMLTRIYWFTAEFGLIRNQEGLRAYGSGSVSSPQELEFCVSDKCRHHPFDLAVITARPYDIWHIQEDVFVVDSFEQLSREFKHWAGEKGLL